MKPHAEHEEHDADLGKLFRDHAVDARQERKEAHGHARDDVAHKGRRLEKPFGEPPEDEREPETRHKRGNDGKLIGQGPCSSGLFRSARA